MKVLLNWMTICRDLKWTKAMNTYVFYFTHNCKDYSVNLLIKNWDQAEIVGLMLGYELKGELIETINVNN